MKSKIVYDRFKELVENETIDMLSNVRNDNFEQAIIHRDKIDVYRDRALTQLLKQKDMMEFSPTEIEISLNILIISIFENFSEYLNLPY